MQHSRTKKKICISSCSYSLSIKYSFSRGDQVAFSFLIWIYKNVHNMLGTYMRYLETHKKFTMFSICFSKYTDINISTDYNNQDNARKMCIFILSQPIKRSLKVSYSAIGNTISYVKKIRKDNFFFSFFRQIHLFLEIITIKILHGKCTFLTQCTFFEIHKLFALLMCHKDL